MTFLLLGIISLQAGILQDAALAFKQGNYPKAKTMFKKACDDGDARGCYNLGKVYDLQHDYRTAVKLYKKACTMGYNDSCLILGTMYDNGIGVEESYFRAKQYYGKACDLGNQLGCVQYSDLNR